jgi:mannose/fructose/N-acetylgalactosamine-specific phosphotransferase system component IID
VLDAVPVGIATIPEDSIAPLLMSLALFGFFMAIIYQRMWSVLLALLVTFAIGCWWMWPRTREEVVE